MLHLRPALAQCMTGGAGRDRTGDLLNANQALSQLSYSPLLSSSKAALLPRCLAAFLQIIIEADWTRRVKAQPDKCSSSNLSGELGVDLEWNDCLLYLDSFAQILFGDSTHVLS